MDMPDVTPFPEWVSFLDNPSIIQLGYQKDNNAAALSVDIYIFYAVFIYTFIHNDASMARCDKGGLPRDRDKKAH